MSKARKIISILLAVAMVLTVAPVSGIASAADNYTYGKLSFSKTDFTVDTTATTKVIRIGNPGTFTYGNTVIKATRSGIPEHSGRYAAIAYAGETPEYPKVVFSITGVQPDAIPAFTSNCGLSITQPSGCVETGSNAARTYTYTAEVTNGTLNAGDDVIYTITYVVSGKTYTATAYAHAENFLQQNGLALARARKNVVGKVKTRMTAVALIQGANMYSGWHEAGGSQRGYINFASDKPLDRGALKGLSAEAGDFSTESYAFGKSDNTNGTVKKFQRTNTDGGYGSEEKFGYGNDKNRPESTVYLDKRSGSGSETPKDVNMRLAQFFAEAGDFAWGRISKFTTYDKQITTKNDEAVPDGENPLWTRDMSQAKTLTQADTGITTDWNGNYNLVPFGGTGPVFGSTAADTYGWSLGLFFEGDNSNDDRLVGISAYMNVTFKVYDTTDLWNVYKGVLKGDGSTYTTTRLGYTADTAASANQSITFNKGSNPQEAAFSADSWLTFRDALNYAGRVLATPDTNQTTVNAATRALINAYNGLSGYANVKFEVRHVLSGTNEAIIPSQTTDADGSTTKPAGTIMSHSAATIEGYTLVGSASGTTLLLGREEKVVVTYTYQLNSFSLVAYTNNDASMQDGYENPTYPVKYGDVFSRSTLDSVIGTKAGYTFDGWYYDSGTWAQPVPESIKISNSNVMVYAKWKLAPITLTVDVSAAGKSPIKAAEQTPSTLGGEVSFTKPAFADIEGYIFIDYYTDSTYATKVTWPLTVTADTTIYARLDDVNGKITFDSMGGTSVSAITYNVNVPIAAPADPTREGYTFKGWYYDSACTNPVQSTDGTIWKNGKSITRATMTGFVAYAGWEANQVTLTFNVNIPSSETSSFNTVAGTIPSITGYADEAFPESFEQPVPRRLGYEFAYWSYQDENTGRWYEFKFDSYPTKDLALRANWKASNYSAFIDITAYQKLLGEDVEVSTARRGDTITFRMTSQTNFYTGSSVFVFMYDNRFFEPVKQGTDAFVLNPDNDYIKGISAEHYGVTNNAVFASRWPSTLDGVNYNAMMITIDPDVSVSQTTAPMKDGTWMLEFKLAIKDGATGSGKVYMDNAWTRTPDNVLGTMFYGWTQYAAPVYNTYNNVVIPNLDDATATITLDETAPVMTTVTVKTNSTAYPGAQYPDGATEKTFTGRAGQEIEGYVSPTCPGYELTGWVGETDSTQTWVEGFYLGEGATETTYVAQWTPKKYTVNFYKNEGDTEVYRTLQVDYNTTLPTKPRATQVGYTFANWYYIDSNGNKVDVDLDTFLCPIDGVDFYAKWEPASVNYTIKAIFTAPGSETASEKAITKKALTDSYIDIVESMPATELENHNYVLTSGLSVTDNSIKYEFDPSDSRNNPLPSNVKVMADGSTEITLYFTVAKYTVTFNVGEGGTFADGTTDAKVIQNVPHGTLTSSIVPEVKAIEGYEFSRWNPNFSETTAIRNNATYTALFTAASVDVTFDANGGTFSNGDSTTTKSSKYNANIGVPTAPSKPGYNFAGWSTDKDAETGSTSLGTLTTLTPPTYYAIYSAIDYSVIYVVNGETLYTDSPYHVKDTVTVRAAETKTGYAFDGWYNGDVKVTTLTMGTENITLTGSFTPNKYDVIFYHNDGTDANTKVSVAFDSQITAPATNPTRNGYTFKGWATSSEATADEVISTYDMLTTVTPAPYYAVWEANTVDYYVNIYLQDVTGNYPDIPNQTITLQGKVGTVCDEYAPGTFAGFTFDASASTLSGTITPAEDGALMLTVKYTRNKYALVTKVDGVETSRTEYYYGAPVATPDDGSKTGYTFASWTPAVPETMPIPTEGTDYVLTALFTPNKYTVNFYEDATDASPAQSYQADFDSVITPASVSKEGYDFLGWAYKGTTDIINFSDDANPVTVKTEGNDFVAIWQVKKYTLTYNLRGGTTADPLTYEVEYGTPKSEWPAPTPTRVGYEFGGWTVVGYTGDTMPAQEITIRASWSQITYKITFTNTGDSTVADISGVYNSSITAPATPVKEGYTFLGWYESGSDDPYEFPATMPDIATENHTLVLEGKWKVNSYTIIFKDADGTTVYETITQDYGTEIVAPEDPTKTGYTFKKWDTEIPATMPVTPEGGLIITAEWTINSYKITFDSDGGTKVDDAPYNYGAQTAAPDPAPTKTGYTFDCWTLNGVEYTFGTMPANDVSLKAKWTVNQYTISFDSDGGTAVSPITKDYNTAVTAPDAPTKTGYTFAGWYLGENKYTFDKMPAEDIELTAHWTVNGYKITFNSNGGTAVEDASYDFGAQTSAPVPAPTKTGYTFAGWYLGDDEYTFGTMPANDVALTAHWNVNSYKITFNSDGGTAVEDATYNYGAQTSAPTAPTKTGYTFDGWTLDGEAYTFGTMPANDVNLKAEWTINSYTLKFVDAQGADFKTYTVEYNSDITVPETAPVKEYYNFIGWSLDGTTVPEEGLGKMPANDVTVYPVFERVTVALEKSEESTVVIDKENKHIQPPVTGYIYGLSERLTEEALLAGLAVKGDGTIKVTKVGDFKYLGTGTKIDIIDNVTSETVETYYIIIFGDVNGDSIINASDASIVNREANGKTSWSQDTSESYDYCKVLAADADKSNSITADDFNLVAYLAMSAATVDQATGVFTANA